MKVSTYLVLLFAAFVCMVYISSSVTAFEPAKVEVNPELANFTAQFLPPQIFNVTDGVYVARGYNRDNPVLIEGRTDLLLLIPGRAYLRQRLSRKHIISSLITSLTESQ